MIQFVPFAAVGALLLGLRFIQGVRGSVGRSASAGQTGDPLYAGGGGANAAVGSAIVAMIAANVAVGGNPYPVPQPGTVSSPTAVVPPGPPHVTPPPTIAAPPTPHTVPTGWFVPPSQAGSHPDYVNYWTNPPTATGNISRGNTGPENDPAELIRPGEAPAQLQPSRGIHVTPAVYPAGFVPPNVAVGPITPQLSAPGAWPHPTPAPTPAPVAHRPPPIRFVGPPARR